MTSPPRVERPAQHMQWSRPHAAESSALPPLLAGGLLPVKAPLCSDVERWRDRSVGNRRGHRSNRANAIEYLEGAYGVPWIDWHRCTSGQRRVHPGIEEVPAAAFRGDRPYVVASVQPTPPLLRLDAIRRITGAAPSAQHVLLTVQRPDDVGAALPEHSHTGPRRAGQRRHREMAAHAGFVPQRAEHIVVGTTPVGGDLTVEILHRPEELGRLVDKVAAQVEQDAAARAHLLGSFPARHRGPPTLEP